jgi:Sodium/calcium exchanger protein
LGATAAIASLAVPRRAVRRDLTAALTAPLLTAVLAADGRLDSGDGLVLLVAFGGSLSLVLHQTLRTRRADGTPHPARGLPAGAAAVAGLGLLMASPALVVTAARGIGAWLGTDDFVVGATLVAIGTCTPELVTAVVAARRGQGGMGFGLVLGGLPFNGLVAVAVLIAPIEVPRAEAAVGLASGVRRRAAGAGDARQVRAARLRPRGAPAGRLRRVRLRASAVSSGAGRLTLASKLSRDSRAHLRRKASLGGTRITCDAWDVGSADATGLRECATEATKTGGRVARLGACAKPLTG